MIGETTYIGINRRDRRERWRVSINHLLRHIHTTLFRKGCHDQQGIKTKFLVVKSKVSMAGPVLVGRRTREKETGNVILV